MMYENEPKKWNRKCPECGSETIWSLGSGRPGAEASTICARNMRMSITIPISSIRDYTYCSWEGIAVRQKDQSVRIKNLDGTWLKEYHWKKS